MKIAIIGCGYVGSAIARFWNQSGHIITATTTSPSRIAELEEIAKRVVVMKGNNLEALIDVVQNQDLVVLSVGAANRNLSTYQETYLGTAKNLVTALQQNNSVKQVIYTGSYAIYGEQQGKWVDEEFPVAPANENGKVLCATEQILLEAQNDNLKVCVFRLGGIYGLGREIVKIFRPWAGTTRPGDGEGVTNWIHLEDIVVALELTRRKRLQGIYNLANDLPITKRKLLDGMCEHHNLPKISWDGSVSQTRTYNARLSNKKIKAEGFKLIYQETLL